MILESKFNLNTFTYSKTAIDKGIDNTEMTDEVFENLHKLHELLINIQIRISIKENKAIPIKINSGYRCPELNKLIGGVPTSEHVCRNHTAAADTIAIGISLERYFELLKQLAKEKVLVFGQVILEFGKHPETNTDDWVHLSLPTERHTNEFMRSPIMKGDGANVNGKRQYIKEG